MFPSLSVPIKEHGKGRTHATRASPQGLGHLYVRRLWDDRYSTVKGEWKAYHKAWAICTCGGCDIISGEGRKLLGSAVDAEERVCVCPIHSHTKAAKKEGRRRVITYISNTGDTGAIRRDTVRVKGTTSDVLLVHMDYGNTGYGLFAGLCL